MNEVLMGLYTAATLITSPIHQPPMNFEESLERTLHFEGGGTTHEVSGDPGGLTKWGISQRAYPNLDIASLTREEAEAIYRSDYWDAVLGDHMPPELRPHLFDAAVNQGPTEAVRLLQRALNLYSRIGNGGYVHEDGVLGPVTLNAIDQYPPDRLTVLFRHMRGQRYVQLAEAGRSKFLFGWLKRV